MRGGGGERPESDGVVEGGGDECVGCRRKGERGDGRGVGFEVAQVLVVVRGEVADRVVAFGRGVEDRLGVVGEACEVGAVFLREEGFQVSAFFGVVQLQGFVAAGCEEELARVVE